MEKLMPYFQMLRRVTVLFILSAVPLFLLLILLRPSQAAVGDTYLVTTANDSDDGTCDADCSLREAIAAAGDNGAGMISFNLPPSTTIVLSGTHLSVVTGSLWIDGSSVPGLAVSGNQASRVLWIGSGTAVTISHLAIIEGYAGGSSCPPGCGGGIFNQGNLTLNQVWVMDNVAPDSAGGGVHNDNGAVLTLEQSRVTHNSASTVGGGLVNAGTLYVWRSTIASNDADFSGGLHNTGPAVIQESAVYSNTADIFGGGIRNENSLTVTNSTISHNHGGDGGSGISNLGALVLENSTLLNNTGFSSSEGLFNSGTMSWTNTVVSNAGDDCTNLNSILLNEATLAEDGNCEPTYTADPELGPLQDNGGPTWSHAPEADSPLIDQGSDPCPAIDQRGAPRPEDGDDSGTAECDIGAYEYSPPAYLIYIPLIQR
jgi:CSLREA domain-containing protein